MGRAWYSNRMAHERNQLLELPPAALAIVAGDGRRRLVGYLSRWGHYDACLAYLDAWLADQPGSVTLREGRARMLVELGRGAEALGALDQLDAERPPSVSRRQLRVRALAAARRYSELDLALDALAEDEDQAVFSWLLRGDSLRGRGHLEEAAEAFRQAIERDPAAVAPVRRLAELALEQGDPEAARGQIDALMLRPGYSPQAQDLQILLRAAELAADAEALPTLQSQLAALEAADRTATAEAIGARSQVARSARLEVAEEQPAPLLPDEAYALLRELFGLNEFRPNQARVIHAVLAGEPTFAVMPTGAGKSLTYQLPALLLPEATVVVSPLIALMKDQIDGLPPAAREQATVINSSLGAAELASRLRALAAGQYKLVYVAPERLRQRAFLHALKRCGVSRMVIDEVHCLSLWGQSFRPDYLFIGQAIEELGRPPVLALTATATRETQAEIRASLGESETVVASVFRPNLYFQVLRAGNRDEKLQALIDLCRHIDGPIIVYARARQACEELAEALRSAKIAADHYHAQVPNRDAAQERFMRGETRVLVATVAFGMGIDKPDIRAIVHYNLPQSVEAYYQEAGRAGRDGLPATCVLLYAASDKGRLSSWLEEEAITRDQLRELFKAVRRLMRGAFDVIDLNQLQRALPGEDDTLVRVGLSMLERVGLLRRHFDLPESATLTLTGAEAPDDEAARVAELAGLAAGAPQEVDLLLLAEQAELSPAALEAALLGWHDAGFLRFRGGLRQPLIELLPAPSDVAERIDKLLRDYRERQEQRVEAMAGYARTTECRHRALAAHFGQRLAPCRTNCDICAPQAGAGVRVARTARAPGLPSARDTSDPRPDVRRTLDGLANLPFAMGRSGLARALKGGVNSPVDPERLPEHGALRHLSLTAIEDLVERLIDEGYIERDEQDDYRRLALTILGKKARRDAAYLPEWGVR
jgi:ATP-dependent DNA helicase RecQ